MKLRTRIFLTFMLVIGLGIFSLVSWIEDEMRPRYMEAQEDILVDLSQLLAAGSAVRPGPQGVKIDIEALEQSFRALGDRSVSAQIYQLHKTLVDIRVYVTNRTGEVVYDSDHDRDLGADYSQWRDVHYTLRGEYGARSTDGDPLYPQGSTMYVAAPIVHQGDIVGVLSVGKPTRNAERFMANAITDLSLAGLLVALAAILVAWILHVWLSRPLDALQTYAKAVSEGQRVTLPALGDNEMGLVGAEMERMRRALDGKSYVSDYVQALTHELKSPIAAIRGAKELLDEDPPAQVRARFLDNIGVALERMQTLIERLLDLAAIENRPGLDDPRAVPLHPLLEDLRETMHPIALQHQVELTLHCDTDIRVLGDTFLLEKALTNLVKNAIEFSAPGGRVDIRARGREEAVEIGVTDQGAGIPDYAASRIFDRFYALPKPDGQKGSGLGLSFVREIAALLHGSIDIRSRGREGTVAMLTLPKAPVPPPPGVRQRQP
jgi:two-component system sensor histidine kinase CreC